MSTAGAPSTATPPAAAAAAPAAASAPAPAAAAPTTETVNPGSWMAGFNDDMKGYVQNKGFKGPQDVVDSYRQFEKLQGVPQDRIVKLPESLESPEGKAVWERLGAPKDAKEYKFETPQGGDPKQVEWLAQTMHELSVPKSMAEKFVAKMNEKQVAMAAEKVESLKAVSTQQDTALKKEWGAAFDQNRNIAAQAVRNLGLTNDQVNALGATLGLDGVAKLLHKIGTATGEAKFINGAPGNSGLMTPEQARTQIRELKRDSDFANKLFKGDADAKRKWNSLHEMAHQGETNL